MSGVKERLGAAQRRHLQSAADSDASESASAQSDLADSIYGASSDPSSSSDSASAQSLEDDLEGDAANSGGRGNFWGSGRARRREEVPLTEEEEGGEYLEDFIDDDLAVEEEAEEEGEGREEELEQHDELHSLLKVRPARRKPCVS